MAETVTENEQIKNPRLNPFSDIAAEEWLKVLGQFVTIDRKGGGILEAAADFELVQELTPESSRGFLPDSAGHEFPGSLAGNSAAVATLGGLSSIPGTGTNLNLAGISGGGRFRRDLEMPLYFADELPASLLNTLLSPGLQALFGGFSPGNLGVYALECFIRDDGPQLTNRVTLEAWLIPHFPMTVLSPVCARILGIPANARQHQFFLCDTEFDHRVHPVQAPVRILSSEPQPVFLFGWDALDACFELTNHGAFIERPARNDSRCVVP